MNKSKYQLSPIVRVIAGILATVFLALFVGFLWGGKVRGEDAKILFSLCVAGAIFAYGAKSGRSPAWVEDPEIFANALRALFNKK